MNPAEFFRLRLHQHVYTFINSRNNNAGSMQPNCDTETEERNDALPSMFGVVLNGQIDSVLQNGPQ